MTAMTPVAPHGSMKLAGQYAQAWFDALDGSWGKLTTRERKDLENDILDSALADAGVTPLPEGSSLVDVATPYSVEV